MALLRLPLPGRLAQLGERRLDKAEVTGSSPVSPTFANPGSRWGFAVRAQRRAETGWAPTRRRRPRWPSSNVSGGCASAGRARRPKKTRGSRRRRKRARRLTRALLKRPSDEDLLEAALVGQRAVDADRVARDAEAA